MQRDPHPHWGAAFIAAQRRWGWLQRLGMDDFRQTVSLALLAADAKHGFL